MNDDWRLQVRFQEESHARALTEWLDAERMEHELSDAFGDRVVVSRDGAHVFLYAGDRGQAERARNVVESEAKQHGWATEVELRHWHPSTEEWEDPDKPLPDDEASRLAEHEALIAREREEAAAGHPEYEVRVDLPSRHEAAAFSERLRDEGLPAVHRWRFLLVGASDEDSAKQLAERIRAEAPDGSTVAVEGTWAEVLAERPSNPFAVLGGLGG